MMWCSVTRKLVSQSILVILLVGAFSLAFQVLETKAQSTVNIWDDGSIYPPDAPIERDGETYTLLGNIITDESAGIEIFRSGITLDGSGYTVQANSVGVSITVDSVTIKDLTVTGCGHGISAQHCSDTVILENTVTGNEVGLSLDYDACYNQVYGNVVTGNEFYGISVASQANYNEILQNSITANGVGIALRDGTQGGCRGSVLRGNEMWNNTYNFQVTGNGLPDFVHDIDLSNTVDGRSVYYWVNREHEVVPSDAGYVALVNCSNMIVQDLNLSHNCQGILLMHTTESMISGNELTHNERGIGMLNSSFNALSDNIITDNTYAILASQTSMLTSSNNSILKNRMESNLYGLHLIEFCNGSIQENDIVKNHVGLLFKWSHHNLICHNSFNNNTRQVDLVANNFGNRWDNGYPSGGNYWSDHSFTDSLKGESQDESGSDGICDEWYYVDPGNDYYPLMGTFQDYSTAGGNVNVVTNSTLVGLSYSESEGSITIEVSGIEGYGFCTVCIPHTVMDVDSISVTIDGGLTEVLNCDDQVFDNGTHRWIYFGYEHSTHEIVIIPEFPLFFIFPLFMVSTLLAVIVYRRKHSM